MKSRILQMLRASQEPVSGQDLAQALCVSRVAVWKHVQALKDLGYPIVSSRAGYRLEGPDDFLFPWEFAGREDRVHYFPETASTMDAARDLARRGCPDGTVVIAGTQTAGRGRMERAWLSDAGGLYFTMVTRPSLPASRAFLSLFAASVALALAVRETTGVLAKVKWPNDLLADEKKIAGMLSEMLTEGDAARYVNLGIGLNVNNDPSGKVPQAVSLSSLAGKSFSRRKILERFLDAYPKLAGSLPPERILDRWREMSATLNKPVRIVTQAKTLEGFALDIGPDGALIVRKKDGSLEQVTYGDCLHGH